jgi:hypothetical protein
MPNRKSRLSRDPALGMEAPITRRDFLGSALLASGAVLLGPMTPAELLAGQDEFTGYARHATRRTDGVPSHSSSEWPLCSTYHGAGTESGGCSYGRLSLD